jgi:hypothetical protein
MVVLEDGSALVALAAVLGARAVPEAPVALGTPAQTPTNSPPVPTMAAAGRVSKDNREETLVDNTATNIPVINTALVLLQTLIITNVKRRRLKSARKKSEPRRSGLESNELRRIVLGRNVPRKSVLEKNELSKSGPGKIVLGRSALRRSVPEKSVPERNVSRKSVLENGPRKKPNVNEQEKKRGARKRYAERWKSSSANVMQKPKRKKNSASAKQWRKN